MLYPYSLEKHSVLSLFYHFVIKNTENFIISLGLYTTITKNGNFSIKSTLSIKRTPKLFFAKSSIKRTLQSQNQNDYKLNVVDL